PAQPPPPAPPGADPQEHHRVDSVALAPGQRFPRELQDDAAVGRATAGVRRHDYPLPPIWKRAKRLTRIFSLVEAFTWSTRSFTLVLPVPSFTKACSSRQFSLKNFSSLPSTILSITWAGFFWSAICER